MSLLKVFLVALISFILIGCAASGPRFSAQAELHSDTSEIIVYRPDHFARGGVKYLLNLDDKEVATLQNAGFASILASAGKHELEIHASFFQNFKPMKVLLDTQLGSRVFVRFEPSISGAPIVSPSLIYMPVGYDFIQVPEAQALDDLKDLKLSK